MAEALGRLNDTDGASEMIPDYGGVIIFLFVIIGVVIVLPVLGLVTGAITGWRTPRMSTALGAGIGLLSTAGAIILAALSMWLSFALPWSSGGLFFGLSLCSLIAGLIAPVFIIEYISNKRKIAQDGPEHAREQIKG